MNEIEVSGERKTGETEMITIRIKCNFDEDFIEVDIDKLSTDFESFKKICLSELDQSMSGSLVKIRKLPNILIRNSKDIRRLKNEQEIEFVFS